MSTTAPPGTAVEDPGSVAAEDLSPDKATPDSQANPTVGGNDPASAEVVTATADPAPIVSASFLQPAKATSSIVQVVTTLQVAPGPSSASAGAVSSAGPDESNVISTAPIDSTIQPADPASTQQPWTEPYSHPTAVAATIQSEETTAGNAATFTPSQGSSAGTEVVPDSATESRHDSPIVVAGQTVSTASDDGIVSPS